MLTPLDMTIQNGESSYKVAFPFMHEEKSGDTAQARQSSTVLVIARR